MEAPERGREGSGDVRWGCGAVKRGTGVESGGGGAVTGTAAAGSPWLMAYLGAADTAHVVLAFSAWAPPRRATTRSSTCSRAAEEAAPYSRSNHRKKPLPVCGSCLHARKTPAESPRRRAALARDLNCSRAVLPTHWTAFLHLHALTSGRYVVIPEERDKSGLGAEFGILDEAGSRRGPRSSSVSMAFRRSASVEAGSSSIGPTRGGTSRWRCRSKRVPSA